MIDVEVDIFNYVAQAILDTYKDAYVSSENVIAPPMFPAVSIVETLSSEVDSMRDSSFEENGNALTYTINIYSNSESNAKTECKALLQIIDQSMRRLNFKRLSAQTIDNAKDPSIYRIVSIYTGIVDKNSNLYWR